MIRTHAQTKDTIRVIPLGGVEEIGKNMTAIEYKGDIIAIDAGVQFPDEDFPGINYIIPNTKYLEARRNRVKALFITHGHLDHVGAIPYILDRIGNPTIYTNRLTRAMIEKRMEEFPHLPKARIQEVHAGENISFGAIRASFFDTTHTIADALGIIVHTELGDIVYPGDFKIEHDGSGTPTDTEREKLEMIGKGNNLLLMLESTNVERPGFSLPEKTVHKNLEELFKQAPGRIITATFASLLERVIEIIQIAERLGRRVVIDGRSMKVNLEIANQLGLVKLKKDVMIPIADIGNYPPEKIVAIVTGAQGEENAALMRIAEKRHKHIKVHKKDTVFLSSSIIPGNEKSVDKLKDELARQGARIIHYGVADIHSSGHAYRGELELMHRYIKAKFFVPIHGTYFKLHTNGEVAEDCGIPEQHIVIPSHNGAIIEVTRTGIRELKESAPHELVVVDGSGVGDVQEVVIRDRQALAQEGIFVIIVVIDSKTGAVKVSPDIISRGFIYLRESQELLKRTRYLIRKTAEDATAKMHPLNVTYLRELLRKQVSKYLFQKTKRNPMVLPVIIEA